VKLTVYDISGQEAAVLADGFYPAGAHQTVFDGTELPSGIYFAQIEAGDFREARKIVLIK
jgi:hypothetical protein